MYRRDPILSSSPPPGDARSRSGSREAQPDATQPTQLLESRSPFFAAPTTTQPTLMVTPPRATRIPVEFSSQLQVPRSSPAGERFSSPGASGRWQEPLYRSNPMAPPGTSFFPPQAVRKPVVVISDDPPVERDSDEEESEYRSNIPLSKVELGSRTSRVEETPPKPMADLSHFRYNENHAFKRRPSDGHGSSTPPKKQKPMPRQGGPSRAMPVDLTDDEAMTVNDIADLDIKRKTERVQAVFPNRSVKHIYEALVKKRGHFDDACAYLADEESDDELVHSPPNPTKKTAQRTLQAPVKSLAAKYSRPSNTTQHYETPSATPSSTAAEEERPKPKRRLIRGRRNRSPSPQASPQKPQVTKKKQQAIVISDDEDEGIVEVIDDDSDSAASVRGHSFEESSLLNFFNTCTVEAMVDLSGLKEEEIRELFEQRPFASLEAIKMIHVDLQQKKAGKKPRKPRITFGARLVEAAEDMWDAYSTIDRVVQQCEEMGKPMINGMARWGVNIFGTSKDGEVEVTSIDSDSSSTRDSGYHTPRSGHASDADEKIVRNATSRSKLLTKPSIMNDDIELKDYQVVGLNWLNLLWQNGISGILADDMGLGKTCQVIAFLSHLKEQKEGTPALIIVPGSTLENWCREFQRFSKTVNFIPYYGGQAERSQLQDTILDDIENGDCDVIITTYDLAYRTTDNKFLRKCHPCICIFDEGHMLKNASTIRYKNLMRLNSARCRILLTGTPLQNSLQELMSILGFLMPKVFYSGSEDDPVQQMLQILFKHKAKVTESDSHSTLLSAQRIERARTMLTPFILRRKKAQVLKHLPKKTSRVEYCELTKTAKTLYEEQRQRQRKVLEDRAAGIMNKDHANVMMKLRQAAIHPLLLRHHYDDKKIKQMAKACLKEPTFAQSDPETIFLELQLYQDYQCHQLATKYPGALKKFELKNKEWMDSGKVTKLLELLKKYKANGDRALVFSQFTSVMDILGWMFDDHDINYMRMDGSTPIAERQSLMDIFYQDESIQLFMISTKSGGAGINLACANKVIIFDSSFNPQDDIQAENRAHRVGQTREVEVVRLVTKDTVEEQIYALGVSKLELDKMIQGEESEEPAAGKKKGAAGGAGADKLSKAEEAGIEAVEKMMLAEFQGKGKVDVKEQFLDGLKKAGLDVAA
ncbi:hypothetical protein IQ07DRAFT_583235 [Pyrenochaeta sp. DS3sAY3a]|nr:hypothetical protein IQ07DRAFT_583235 [Pyrenochaeta sp. DS3sAY3a]